MHMMDEISAAHLPRWRGFNLMEKFISGHDGPYLEWDFDTMAEWGFDFVRLPTDYRCWTTAPGYYREEALKEIDQAVTWGRERRIHINICLHRAPGYCVNPPAEPLNLWSPEADGVKARKQFAAQWGMFAERYRGISNAELSFDLVNEPAKIPPSAYLPAVQAAVDAIRSVDPGRLIVADGLEWGNIAVPELAPLKIAQSTRGYQPMNISHYKAGWVEGSDRFPLPQWPLPRDGQPAYDRETHWREQIEPWLRLREMGVGVHVGEWGAFIHTPHAVTLAWMADLLANWKRANFGWAMWNFRGAFGVLNSNRADVKYEPFKGHLLDRAMLELIRRN
jgi:endoglucanase